MQLGIKSSGQKEFGLNVSRFGSWGEGEAVLGKEVSFCGWRACKSREP